MNLYPLFLHVWCQNSTPMQILQAMKARIYFSIYVFLVVHLFVSWPFVLNVKPIKINVYSLKM